MWKKNAFVVKMDGACSAFLRHSLFIVKMFYLPEEIKCPLPKVKIFDILSTIFNFIRTYGSVQPEKCLGSEEVIGKCPRSIMKYRDIGLETQ